MLRLVGRWARKPVNHTSWVAVVTPTDRPKSVRNRCLIELFCGVVFLVCCDCDTSYIVSFHIQSSLHIYTFVVSRAFMAGAASQAGDADSSRAPGLTSGLQGSVNVHHGALLLVPQ